jgi:hypothetical protein
MLGDVNISAILDSLSVGYDKRVRPNYGGKSWLSGLSVSLIFFVIYIQHFLSLVLFPKYNIDLWKNLPFFISKHNT